MHRYAGNIGLAWAMRAGWVEFWFQPKINLRTRQVCGVEMFARLRHPLHGVIPARTFLVGADPDTLNDLTVIAIQAARQAAVRLGQMGARFPIALNAPSEIDSCLFMVDEIFDRVRQGLTAAHNLVLDVPEQTILADPEQFTRLAIKLSAYGVKLAVDDFGGHLCKLFRPGNKIADEDELQRVSQLLNALKDVQFFEFKLDRKLIAGSAKEPRRARICGLIIDLVQKLGSTAVAVGIESAADARCMVSLGCGVGQGHLFSEPVPLGDFMTLLKSRMIA
jgi:EAL domain-containing protein (putative c-di-GMP-specific phosphodiesterase class I)